MRKVIGGVVLAAGIGGLGWYGSANNAKRMQTQVAEGAAKIANASAFGVQTDVSGRDIVAMGNVADQAEFDRLKGALNDVEGRRVVDMSGITLLPVADPFEMTAIRADDGTTTLSGAIGGDVDREIVAVQAGDLANDLILSSGTPDDGWAGVSANAMAGLAQLKSGEMTLSDRTLTLTGLAQSPVEKTAALNAIGELPDGYTLNEAIDVEDDGTPLRLMLTSANDTVSGTGKVPADMTAQAISDAFDTIGDIDVIEAGPAMNGSDWDGFARQGMTALAMTDAGVLAIEDKVLTLTGTGTPDGIAAAKAALSDLPNGYTATTDLTFTDDGAPLSLSMEYDGRAVTADGKYPAGYTPNTVNDAGQTNTGRNSFFADDTGMFTANADAGIAALGLLEDGSLSVTENEIILTGTAATPDIEAAVTEALQSAAEGSSVQQDLTLIDDGSPASWALDYSAANGGDVTGKLPKDLTTDAIAAALGVNNLDGTPTTALLDGEAGPNLSALEVAAEYLPDIEALSYSTSEDGQALDIVLSPGVNADLVAADLAQRLSGDVDFTASSMEELPDVGAIRTNQATMQRERFQFGNWLPILSFAPVPSICRDQSGAALEGTGVNFISGSAQLDAKSNRAINALSAIAQRCISEGGLSLEVGGHTDNTGNALNNEVLSENRAKAVRDALIARGADAAAITATGFGQTQPIADNETQDGRAANRRTEFIWSE